MSRRWRPGRSEMCIMCRRGCNSRGLAQGIWDVINLSWCSYQWWYSSVRISVRGWYFDTPVKIFK